MPPGGPPPNAMAPPGMPQGPGPQGQPGYGYGPAGYGPAGYGYGQQPVGPGGPPLPPKKSNVGKILLIVGAGVVVLVLIAVAGAIFFASPGTPTGGNPTAVAPQSSGPPSTGPTSKPPPVPANPSDAVQTYLEALAAGNADVALALTTSPPADQTLLTSAVLAQSKSNGGVTHIKVAPVTDQTVKTLPATYQVGKVKVSESFAVTKVGDQWKVDETYSELDLSKARSSTYPLTVNKVRVLLTRVNVFPGTYVLGASSSYVSYGKSVVVTKPGQTVTTSGRSIRITSAGSKRMVAAAKGSLATCLKQHKLAPKGCPFAATANGYKVTVSTVRWKLQGSPFKKAKAKLVAGRVMIATTTVNLTVKGSVRCKSSTFTGTCTVTINRRATAIAVLSAGRMTIGWSTKAR
jgi:hypothetical protein